MKKVVVLMSFAVVALFAACKSSEAQAPVEAEVTVDEAVVVDSVAVDSVAADTVEVVATEVVAE